MTADTAMYGVDHDLLRRLEIADGALEGRVALVTGGARGIGQGAVLTMAALGARLVVIDIRPDGQAVVDAIEEQGGEATFIQGDLSVVEELERMASAAVAAYGRVDVLINSAVRLNAFPLLSPSSSADEWDKAFATNARAPFLMIRRLLPAMLERKDGVIINMVAYEGGPLATIYCGTKMALRSMALSIARELGSDSGVSSFSFVPGIVSTRLVLDVLAPQIAEALGAPIEKAMEILAQNPGYPGLIPTEHCVTALVYAVVHAKEYHGQVADPFEPLGRYGVIDLPAVPDAVDPEEIDVSGPHSGRYLKQYLGKVISLNRELEERIELRTRELKEAQAQLIESERQAALGHLAAGVMHEINTPLGAMRSSVDTLGQLLEKSLATISAGDGARRASAVRGLERANETLATIAEASKRIGDATSLIEQFTGLDAAERKSIDVQDSVESVIAMFHGRSAAITLDFERASRPQRVLGHPARLNQALRALLDHAVECADHRVSLVVDGDEADVRLTIEADGRSPEDGEVDALFELRLVDRGGRIGMQVALPLAKRAIDEAGGTLVLEPARGGGTRICVMLPRS